MTHSATRKFQQVFWIVLFCKQSIFVEFKFSVAWIWNIKTGSFDCTFSPFSLRSFSAKTVLEFSLCGNKKENKLLHKCSKFLFVCAHVWSSPGCIISRFSVLWEKIEMLPVLNIVGKTKDRNGHFEFKSLLQ